MRSVETLHPSVRRIGIKICSGFTCVKARNDQTVRGSRERTAKYRGFESYSSSPTDTTESCRYYLLCKAQPSDNNTLEPSNSEAKHQGNVEVAASLSWIGVTCKTDGKPARIAIQRCHGHLEMLTGGA